MKLTHAAKRGLCWLFAALMTAAMFVFVLLCTDVQYATNDDAGIMRAFLGYESGTPANFHIFIHGLLAWPLYWLSCAFPALPWFTYLQLALLALACTVLIKSILQCFLKHQKPLWLGAVLAAAFLWVICMPYVSQLTFTQTSALLAAAAVLQMFSIEHDRGGWRVVTGMAGALALMALGYALREESLLPDLAFCGLAFVMLFVEHYGLGQKAKRCAKPMLVSLLVVAVAVGGLLGARQLEYQREDVREYLTWHNARTSLTDFYNLDNLSQEALDEAGFSASTLNLIKKACFLDSAITADGLDILRKSLAENDTRTPADRLSQAWVLLSKVFTDYPLEIRCLLLSAIVGALALLGALLFSGKRGRLTAAILSTLILSAAMLFYLALQGRLPLRAALVVFLPATSILLALLPACTPRRMNGLLVLCCALCVGQAAWSLAGVIPTLLPDPEKELELGSAMSDLEEYASWEPESLFIYDDTLVGADLRAFPDFSEGMPHNITFWGGWDLRSPESVAQFERFGIDLLNLDPETLLREDVYIASGRIDPPPERLLSWVQARLGPDVECELWSEYGVVYIFHFYRY